MLSIDELVLDPTVRENLHVDDHRDVRDREQYLAGIVASGGKCVTYVNSRDQSLSLARMLRKRLPNLAPYIGFYNAGLSKPDRKAIEDAFRKGELRCIISTSAFGEGIDIPDIEHVILYHLPFNDIEFNQMSGRAVVMVAMRRSTCSLAMAMRASTRPYSSPALRHARPSSFSIASCASSRNGRRRRVTGDSPAPIANWPIAP